MHKISRASLNFIYQESRRTKECGMNSKKCGCVIKRNYGLSYACVITKKIKNGRSIWMRSTITETCYVLMKMLL